MHLTHKTRRTLRLLRSICDGPSSGPDRRCYILDGLRCIGIRKDTASYNAGLALRRRMLAEWKAQDRDDTMARAYAAEFLDLG